MSNIDAFKTPLKIHPKTVGSAKANVQYYFLLLLLLLVVVLLLLLLQQDCPAFTHDLVRDNIARNHECGIQLTSHKMGLPWTFHQTGGRVKCHSSPIEWDIMNWTP